MSGVQPHSELNQNQTEILRHCAPAGARLAGGGSPVQVVDVYNRIHNIQLSRNFREYTCYFCQLEKKNPGKRQQTVWGGSGRIVYDNVGDDDDGGGGDDEDEDKNDANEDVEDDNIAEDEVEEGDVAKDEVEDDDVEDDDVEDDDIEDDDVEDDEV